ncbi:MAG: ATP phosphoribosyltransferase regulatory subunit [Fusobacterium sp. JB019]|nr:ATP phosphoribosyltransferase regulatory subunit [Fusobacterium sp. JB019]
MKFTQIKDELNYSSKKYQLTREIEDIFINFKYIKLEPSIFEDYDDFTSINQRIKKEKIVKVINSNSKILILRPDITMNIIKKLIPRWEDDIKVKLFYNSSIFVNESNTNIKEFSQMGVEYLGEDSIDADIEIIQLVFKILKKYNKNFLLEIGNSKYINGLLDETYLTKSSKLKLKDLIYKKNKNELIKYVSNLNLKKEIKNLLFNILDFQGNMEEVIIKAEKFYMNQAMKNSIAEIKNFKKIVKEYDYLKYIHLDLSLITELDYYDGLIFKGYYENSYAEIIRGGRYNLLTQIFNINSPGIGFSINLDELIKIFYKEGE